MSIRRTNGKELTYDPARIQGVNVYQQLERNFSVGDRIQFTGPYRDQRIANRQLGTIKRIHNNGMLALKLDSGCTVEFSVRKHPHLDYGYAVTSHSSQGVTADRVLMKVDTTFAREKLLNSRFAYVAVSRARFEARVYTNHAQALGLELSREVSKRAAIERRPQQNQAQRKRPAHEQSRGLGLCL